MFLVTKYVGEGYDNTHALLVDEVEALPVNISAIPMAVITPS
jgi:hypothetical protein